MLLAFETGVPTFICSNKPLIREYSEESIKELSEEWFLSATPSAQLLAEFWPRRSAGGYVHHKPSQSSFGILTTADTLVVFLDKSAYVPLCYMRHLVCIASEACTR